MSRAAHDLIFAGIAAGPLLGAVTLYAVCRHAERIAERKPVCGLQYEFTTAALWPDLRCNKESRPMRSALIDALAVIALAILMAFCGDILPRSRGVHGSADLRIAEAGR